MVSLEVSDSADPSWNKRLEESAIGTVYQTAQNGAMMKMLGHDPVFIKFIGGNGAIIGQLLGMTHSRLARRNKIISSLGSLININKKVFQWFSGPVMFDEDSREEIIGTLQEFLLSKDFLVRGYEHPLSPGVFDSFVAPYRTRPWSTFLIDLSQDQSDLWRGIKHSARKNVTRSQKKGVTVERLARSDIHLYQEIRKRDPLDVLEARWDLFHSMGWEFFLASRDGQPLGGLMASSFNGYVNEWGIARTQTDTQEKLYAQDLLKWSIIKWGNESGFRYYDLTGVNPRPESDKEKGISRYKKKWGGRPVRYNLVQTRNRIV